jgi:gamma-glutamyltranspeptidase/glutathione hydrolase
LTLLAGGRGAVAVTTHRAATDVALAIMASGGNAVDAAVAANAVIGIILPDTCGVGGDLFALIYGPDDEAPLCLNASGRAGRGANAALLRASGLTRVPERGPLGVTVPGCVDGWEALLEVAGSRPLRELLGPAITAAGGFEVTPELAASLQRAKSWLAGQESASGLYPGGRVPEAGDVVSRLDLQATLEILATGGREAFFAVVGPRITDATEGALVETDMRRSQANWVDPVSREVFGRTAWTVPPNSQGYLTLAAAWVFERLAPLPSTLDADYHHALIEAYRSVAWERDDMVADPGRAPMSPTELLSESHLAARADAIDPASTTTWPTSFRAAGGTTYLACIDEAGLGVSLIQSNYMGFGSGLGAGDSGVFLHNRGAGFTLHEGHPNELMPGRRPLHTLAPTLWTREGNLDLLLGTRGGNYQPQLLLQVAAHLLYAGLDSAAVQEHPRWVIDEFGSGSCSAVAVEPGLDRVVAGLMNRGHEVRVVDGPQEGWGPVSFISVAGGERVGAADPRVSTAAAGAAS